MTDAEIAALYARAFPNDAHLWSAVMIGGFRAGRNSHIITAPDVVLMATVVADEAEIASLFVEPSAQGQGRARALLSQWLDELVGQGVRVVHLEVAKDNEAAIALYNNMGFVAVRRRKAYYKRRDKTKVDAIVMNMAL